MKWFVFVLKNFFVKLHMEKSKRFLRYISEKFSLLRLIQSYALHRHLEAYNHLTERFGLGLSSYFHSNFQLLQTRSQ